ncbi:competence/damage-inducible protein A [Oceanobacillus sp. 143]|uniref:Putative competence-damage inducible protein n=1 Tax=Oceanobacillus zhaokaii TaxID=2052660 RepID=A0A345PGL5_9BACI|nr:competence/damage-inducible protein A [Oceanobacillus zhaokaii]AXI09145.1 competence/damage-inducible protein A [Oceanobacillus zhaokaii]QGS68689.1 competence/damage-inducible protein A [Oceanobacillus sp. 143]
MQQPKAEIIAVGTELLLGQISNTNAQWISQQLALYGINIYNHVVVGDNLNRVVEAFSQAHVRSDIIIVTGGLGPTEDDLTREAFQQMSQLDVVEHKPSMDKIEQFFKERNTVMTPNNRRQARVFKDCIVLDNKVGMAPGMIVTFENRTWIFLPGVPREMKSLVAIDVLPYLLQLIGDKAIIKSEVLRFIGIGESQLEHEIKDIIDGQSNPTIAPLATDNGVTIRLTARTDSLENAEKLITASKQQILSRIGSFFYGSNEQTLEQQIIDNLRVSNQRLALAESLTGGLVTSKLVSISGASDVIKGGIVCYDTKVKEEILGVSKETIDLFGTVSEQCAIEMATNILQVLDADIGISFTGVAGPKEAEGKPAGTVYIAVCTKDGHQQVEEFKFQGDRDTIRTRTTLKGMEILFNLLKQ